MSWHDQLTAAQKAKIRNVVPQRDLHIDPPLHHDMLPRFGGIEFTPEGPKAVFKSGPHQAAAYRGGTINPDILHYDRSGIEEVQRQLARFRETVESFEISPAILAIMPYRDEAYETISYGQAFDRAGRLDENYQEGLDALDAATSSLTGKLFDLRGRFRGLLASIAPEFSRREIG